MKNSHTAHDQIKLQSAANLQSYVNKQLQNGAGRVAITNVRMHVKRETEPVHS